MSDALTMAMVIDLLLQESVDISVMCDVGVLLQIDLLDFVGCVAV